MLASICLYILHSFYSLAIILARLCKRRREPLPLATERAKTPSHLALSLVMHQHNDSEMVEEILIETVLSVVDWCQKAGIQKLTVYDRQGVVINCLHDIQDKIILKQNPYDEESDSEVEYPLTPPLSDTSDSRPMSPEYDGELGVFSFQTADLLARKSSRRRNVRHRPQKRLQHLIPLLVNLASYESSKPAVASVARSYARMLCRSDGKDSSHSFSGMDFELNAEELNSTLEGRHGLQSPDFMIVHHIPSTQNNLEPLQLHGFPPWQMRLTEFYHNTRRKGSSGLCEQDFRSALDQFAGAEMRLGK